MTKAKTLDIGIKPFLCHKCNKPAVIFCDKKWWCGIIVGMGEMNSKGYCKHDRRKEKRDSSS